MTVDSVDGDQVRGSYAPENAPIVIGASTWHVSTIVAMEPVSDA